MFVGMPWATGIRQGCNRIFTYLCILDYLTSFYDYFMLMRVWIIEEHPLQGPENKTLKSTGLQE